MPFHDAIRQRLQPFGASLTSHRIILYGIFSTFATLAAVANACRNQSNFYSVAVHLSRSGRSILVLANFGFLAALFIGRVMQRIFFGPLQPREVERLYDRTWMFVTESLLAFTIFRDEFDIPFALMFGFLLFVKCFHWLMADRVESMDQITYPGPPTIFYIRMNSLFVTISIIDFVMFTLAVESTLMNGVGGMVLFATEYAILMASAVNAMARYVLTNVEYRRAAARGGENAPPWENKSMYVFYIELFTDFLKLTTYIAFFTIILTFYGLPLNIIRDVYLTARSFIQRLRQLIRYHNATRDMDRRYPNATEEELNAMTDRTCIICREELGQAVPVVVDVPAAQDQAGQANEAAAPAAPPQPQPQPQDGPNVTPKKLPCGHIFHFQCLRSWLERQQSCPTCRRTVLETGPTNRDVNQQQQGQPGQQPNGAPGAPGPAAPQPVLPLQPGQLPQQLPLQQPQNQPYVIRWIRNAFGAFGQPPLVPGQFPNQMVPPQQDPVQQQPPVPPGWGYGQPGAIPPPPPGHYHPQYYPYPYPPPPQPQQLRPAPVVRGFYGPGGVWHPWPAADNGRGTQAQSQTQIQNIQQNQNSTSGPSQSTPQQSHSQPVSIPGPSANLNSAATAPAASSSTSPQAGSASVSESSDSSVTTTDEDSDTSHSAGSNSGATSAATPRDAAALAALKRFGVVNGSKAPGPPSASTGISSSVETRPANTSSTNSPASPPSLWLASESLSSQPQAHTDASQPRPTPTTSTLADPGPSVPTPTSINANGTPGTRLSVPALLPLYDPSRSPASQGVNYIHPFHQNGGGQWRAPDTSSSRAQQHTGYSISPQPYSPQFQYLHASSRASGPSSSHPRRHHQQDRNFPPLNTLPTTLSEEQLSRLDRVTREAIDERLRVLEGMSMTIHRCVEELTRVRSVLPPGAMASALHGDMGPPPSGYGEPSRSAASAAGPGESAQPPVFDFGTGREQRTATPTASTSAPTSITIPAAPTLPSQAPTESGSPTPPFSKIPNSRLDDRMREGGNGHGDVGSQGVSGSGSSETNNMSGQNGVSYRENARGSREGHEGGEE